MFFYSLKIHFDSLFFFLIEFIIFQPLWKSVWQFVRKPYIYYQFCICIPWYSVTGVKNLCSYENLDINVYRNFIKHWQNLEATKMSFLRWKNKLCTSRKWDIIHCPKAMNSEAMEKTGRKLKYVLLNERSNLERQNYGDSKHTGKKMGGPEQFERGRDRQSTEDF